MKDRFVCPLCNKTKKQEKYHCRDHVMDMCQDHVEKVSLGQYLCTECGKDVIRFQHDGTNWMEA